MNKIGKFFRNERGELRLGWQLAAGFAAYAAVFYGVLWGLIRLFARLFSAWNLTNETIAYAPAWARMIVAGHADFSYCLAYILSAIAGLWLANRWTPGKKHDGAMILRGLLMGAVPGMVIAALALLLDSMRLEWPLSEPKFGWTQLSALIVLILGSFSGEALTKRLAFDSVRMRFGRIAGYAFAAILSMILSGRWLSSLGMFNALLMGILSCALYERGGILASTAVQAGWLWATGWLFAWPNSASSSVYRLYTVSEVWLTGGNFGADCGLACMLAWLILIYILMIKNLIKERITNGKDSHCNRRSGLSRRELLRPGTAGNEGPRSGGGAGRAPRGKTEGRGR